MAKFNDKCLECESDLIVDQTTRNPCSDYPFGSEHERGELSIPLICSEGCGYTCFHTFIFVSSVDQKNPLADKSDFKNLFQI